MIFITVKKKTLGIIVLVIILCLIGVTIYSSARIAQNENKYQSVLGITRMFDDTHFITYMSDVSEEEAQREKPNVEVFDISRGEVVVKKPLNADIQNEVFNYVKTIKSLYTKVMPFPEKGYVIRVPFDPARAVDIKLLNDAGIKTLDSVFIIVSDKEAPIILVLDSQRRPYFYTFNASVKPLLDYLKIKPEAKALDENDASQDQTTDLEQEEIPDNED